MKFTQSHEWIRVSDNIGFVGVSHYAQKELGDVVYVELPQKGKSVSQGNPIAVLESTKAAADVYAPVSGKILDVNHQLSDHPELVNSSAEDQGWILKIEITDPEQLEHLMTQMQYGEFIKR